MPGPLLVRLGDHQVFTGVDPARERHELTHPWWPRQAAPFFAHALTRRADLSPPAAREVEPSSGARSRARRPATTLTLPGPALQPGDYLEVIADRYPAGDRSPDEGFARLEWLAVLDQQHVHHLIADPAWRNGPLLLVRTRGSGGILLLRADEPVRVLAYVNPERDAFEGSLDAGGDGPPFDPRVPPARPFTAAEVQAARALRQAAREHTVVPADEHDLYPQHYADPVERRRLLQGVNGVRLVPLSSLPWPHNSFKCAHAERGERIERDYPDEQDADGALHAVHAELFTRLGPNDFATCPYHRANWQLIGALAQRAVTHQGDDWRPFLTAAERDQLTARDALWLDSLFLDCIAWDDGDSAITNGQHRTCALRAAGVPLCPVEGRYVPGDPYPEPRPACEHARQTITRFWIAATFTQVPSRLLAAVVSRALTRWARLRPLIVRPRRP
ncbi:hypothetical protein ABZ260_04070 [Streptosporangium sp. NPDC006013]|uniref:hypothetical protein n=1 Tax=Streptosporangium sp. NPDC006013 TaxID=3155596 RepID=UPI00339E052E